MKEQENIILSPSGEIMQQVLGNRTNLLTFLNEKKGVAFVARVKQAVNKLDSDEMGALAGRLINGLAQDNYVWDADKRDGALGLLQLLNLDEINPEMLKDTYLAAVHTQNETSDPLGSIDALLEAGLEIVHYLPHDETTEEEIRSAWKKIDTTFQTNPAWQAVSPKITQIEQLMSDYREKAEEQEMSSEEMIVQLWQEGKTAKEIGEKLNMQPQSIRNRIFRLRKSGVDLATRTQPPELEAQRLATSHVGNDRPILMQHVYQPSASRRQQVADLWNSGMSPSEITKMLQISNSSLKAYLQKLEDAGVPLEKRASPDDEERRKQIADFLNQGYKPADIALALNIPLSRVKVDIYELKSMGYPLQKRGKQRNEDSLQQVY